MNFQDFERKIGLLQVFLAHFRIRDNGEKIPVPKKATLSNSIYLGQELLKLPFDYQFNGFGRNGVISSDLCADYDNASLYRISRSSKSERNGQVRKIASFLSNFTDEELAAVAQLLWNKGVFLNESERIKANETRTRLLKKTL